MLQVHFPRSTTDESREEEVHRKGITERNQLASFLAEANQKSYGEGGGKSVNDKEAH